MTDENLRRVKPKCFGACRGAQDVPVESPMPALPTRAGIMVKADLSDMSEKLVEMIGSKPVIS
jgi:hypothetical protein